MAVNSYDAAMDIYYAIESDYQADAGDWELEVDPGDIVTAMSYDVEDDDIMREVCRTQLGYVPHDLVARLGNVDWLAGVL